ncbi:MAG: hypothetical protein ACXV5Q_08735 [Frankiaceae bacterium]
MPIVVIAVVLLSSQTGGRTRREPARLRVPGDQPVELTVESAPLETVHAQLLSFTVVPGSRRTAAAASGRGALGRCGDAVGTANAYTELQLQFQFQGSFVKAREV